MSSEPSSPRPSASGMRPGPSLGGWLTRWVGVSLTLLTSVAIVWLGATGRLELYVHPRYTAFTLVLATIGGVLAIAAIVSRSRGPHDTDPETDAPELPRGRRPVWRAAVASGRVIILVVAAVALLVLPPRALTAHTAQSRAPADTDTAVLSSSTAPQLTAGSTASFTVKDWAALLRTGDASAVAGRSAVVTAYVLPVGGARDEFYAARLLVTCCAVDAQPVAVPVYVQDWRSRFAANDWVVIRGHFQQNPDAGSGIPTVLVPDRITKTREPAKPYVY